MLALRELLFVLLLWTAPSSSSSSPNRLAVVCKLHVRPLREGVHVSVPCVRGTGEAADIVHAQADSTP